ncbi:4'-phosphopantetheinyl transferase family protein [Micromonosporaceae bacterium DT194]|uniref:4'-phosphopantetheinyl transferase family protein n=1 Tax=Melissospora conviva TaxID=3388432 RepID=UPI003C292853
MRDLLPPSVAVAVATAADFTGELHPAERACLSATAVESRRREFTAGRVCARRALSALGLPAAPVTTHDRAPVWPPGTIGSITHTAGYCAAVVAHRHDVRALGVDAEQHRPLGEGVARLICLPEELDWCAAAPDAVHWPSVVFSAKESVYKVWHPLAGSWLGFEEARVRPDPGAGTFTALLRPERHAEAAAHGIPTELTGRFVVEGGLVRTALYLPAR